MRRWPRTIVGPTAGKTVIFGFGRVGRMVADMLQEHDRPYFAVDSDIDGFTEARKSGYSVLYGDVSRRELIEKLDLDKAKAVVLTMDDPALTRRIAKRLRDEHPALPIIARARDTDHAAALYRAGVTDAVPETLEASLQLQRGGAGRHRRGDGPGDRQHPRKAQRAARRDHGSGAAGRGAEPRPAAAEGCGACLGRDLLQRFPTA